ncbi:hypothetical protein [Nocardia sp. NPDC056000]|uniref:hypothetical protein n=1 Tax=Nocardia sp. NPDC056000 TaxID=3345674 RepID=UPI0035DF6BC8
MGKTYEISVGSRASNPGDRNSIGGRPLLDADQRWPICGCGTRMTLYFQVQVPSDIRYFGGDQLLVFQCPLDSDCTFPTDRQLAAGFWDAEFDGRTPFWRILLQSKGIPAETADPILRPTELTLRPSNDEDDGRPLYGFKIGGAPYWVQDPESYRCACGTDLVFLAQVPEDFPFSDYLADPDDQDGDDNTYPAALDDGLLLGNVIYIVACPSRCNPAAAWPICQN